MKNVTYKGPTDGSPSVGIRVAREQYVYGKQYTVTNAVADILADVEGHNFDIEDAAPAPKPSSGNDNAPDGEKG